MSPPTSTTSPNSNDQTTSTTNPLSSVSSTTPSKTSQPDFNAQVQARLAYLHNNDRLNGREPPVMGANNGNKRSGDGENQSAGTLASAGAFIAGMAGALGRGLGGS